MKLKLQSRNEGSRGLQEILQDSPGGSGRRMIYPKDAGEARIPFFKRS